MVRACIIAVLLTLVGCAETAERADWYVDSRFTADERAEIEAGAAWLAEQSGAPAPTFASIDVAGHEPMPHTIRRERHAAPETGFCTGLGGTIYLDASDPQAADRLRGLAAHELGHCMLGLADDPESDGIMHVIRPMQWTEREAGQLR